jgi:hypothetical protein
MGTALVLSDDMPLHEAVAKVDAARPHLVITERGECAIVPLVLPGMQKIAVQVDRDEKAPA